MFSFAFPPTFIIISLLLPLHALDVYFWKFNNNIKKLAGRILYPALFRDLTIYRSSSAYNIC